MINDNLQKIISMSDMEIYQDWVKGKISPHIQENDMLGWTLMGLTAETGEVVGLAEKATRKNKELNVDDLQNELGDVIFYWMAAHIAAGIDPDETIMVNMNKLNNREQEGTLLDSSEASDKVGRA